MCITLPNMTYKLQDQSKRCSIGDALSIFPSSSTGYWAWDSSSIGEIAKRVEPRGTTNDVSIREVIEGAEPRS
jgi:hypothetical protein